MNAPSAAPAPRKIIRDRVGNRYLSRWEGDISNPDRIEWSDDKNLAKPLIPAEAHMLRASAISMPAETGGVPELHVLIMNADDLTMTLPGGGVVSLLDNDNAPVSLMHPLQGYYVKHVVDGSSWTITWSKQRVMAAIIPRHAADLIREQSGIPSLDIISVDEAHPGQQPLTSGKLLSPPLPAPAAQIRLRYEILIAPSVEGITQTVNEALAKGAQLLGGLLANPNEYLQPVVWKETI